GPTSPYGSKDTADEKPLFAIFRS
ncbi:MAG: hypothetical protein QOE54_3877, partial [Streptosporangiaceae bacterium]|nr:hypothetical protein [Streptosporangiaceae bacterium]